MEWFKVVGIQDRQWLLKRIPEAPVSHIAEGRYVWRQGEEYGSVLYERKLADAIRENHRVVAT